jgi:assimilatory nitrate reductase catalytic subunit
VSVRGDPAHPANRGKLCVKGNALGETVGLEDRLLQPRSARRASELGLRDHDGGRGIPRLHPQTRPDSVAFYVSGQLLTEDYYVANKLMKGTWQRPHRHELALCMASAWRGTSAPSAKDVVPVSTTISTSGSHRAGGRTRRGAPSSCSACSPRDETAGMKIVALDPRARRPHSSDMHLPLAAGTDRCIFSTGCLVVARDHGHVDRLRRRAHVGWNEALQAARAGWRLRRRRGLSWRGTCCSVL